MEKKSLKPLSYALKLLSIRRRTEKELIIRMEQKGMDKKKIKETIKNLKEWGYINDLEFVKEYVVQKLDRGPYAVLFFERKLLSLGLNIETIKKGIKEVFNENKVIEQSIKVYEKFRKRGMSEENIYSFFMRRGFNKGWVDFVKKLKREEQYGKN